jgi:hypothetical protein
MITCESPTQAFLFLVNTFFSGNEMKSDGCLKYCGYDCFCDLHPYLRRLSEQGNKCAEVLLPECEFLMDLFHCNKHTEPTCYPPDNPLCLYHPNLPKFKQIGNVNTECAEQIFSWLSQLKSIVRHMTQWKFRFFLQVIID